MFRYASLFTLTLLFGFSVYSQQYTRIEFNALNQDKTTRYGAYLLIDTQGFLWYSISEGLVKKMGKHEIFYPYKHPQQESIEAFVRDITLMVFKLAVQRLKKKQKSWD